MNALFQSLQFATPLALFGLLALPVIWWLLRFTPPRPKQIKFPPLRILLGLPNEQETPDKTPWWLLLLRLVLAALFIFAVAQPFLQSRDVAPLASGHRLIILDDGWAAAGNWTKQRERLIDTLEQARRDGSTVTVVGTAPTQTTFDSAPKVARDALEQARLVKPSPLTVDRAALLEKLRGANMQDIASVVWISDGVDGGSAKAFTDGLLTLYPGIQPLITAPAANQMPLALGPMKVDKNDIKVSVLRDRNNPAGATSLEVKSISGRTLLDVPVTLGSATEVPVTFTLPTALRNEIQSIAIAGQTHAGARQLFDDRWRKRTIALQASDDTAQAQLLLSPLHYLRRGLEPFAELYEPQTPDEVSNLMDAGLSMLVLADVGELQSEEAAKVAPWVEKGGILVRFAGPRLAASHDDLLPVILREGGRTLGSALSWDVPQGLQDFPETSPFAGLKVDPSIKVTRQVLAEPDANLAGRTWASLQDGTPLVTAEKRGKGLIVLFHVTANANWSNLPLSGLFLEMLQRVAGLDPATTVQNTTTTDTGFSPRLLLTGEGDLASPDGIVQPIPASDMQSAKASLAHPPGLYARQGKEQALNLSLSPSDLTAMPANLSGIAVLTQTEQPRRDLAPLLFALAALLFLLDTLASIVLGGGFRRASGFAAIIALAMLSANPSPNASAQTSSPAEPRAEDIQAALSARLAYVKTGNEELDATSTAGLKGLTLVLTDRTSATLAEPQGVDIDADEIAFYPLLYWPVDESATPLSDATRAKIVAYMKNGGTIFFDTRDGGLDLSTGSSGNAALQRLLQKLDLPPLEPVPDDHVLTRSFYLLTDFPGRYEGPRPWVEASAGSAGDDPGTSDGVSAIIIGANDYAAAWALDDQGVPLYATVPGSDRQREFAFRTGINLVMYALTGNYKADQVHVPALLERLGQ